MGKVIEKTLVQRKGGGYCLGVSSDVSLSAKNASTNSLKVNLVQGEVGGSIDSIWKSTVRPGYDLLMLREILYQII